MESSMPMMHPGLQNQKLRRRRTCSGCLRYLSIILSVLFAFIAAALVGVFVYLTLTQIVFVKAVLGSDLLIVASGLLVAAGCLLFLVSVIGCVGACKESPPTIVVYVIILSVVFLTLLASVATALVFRTWLTEQVRNNMQDSLTRYYGVDLDNPWNRQVTESWDRAQSLWQCCSVRDNSWSIYWTYSQWYRIQPGTPGLGGKPFVPASCCVRGPDGNIVNQIQCQTKMDGPPHIRESDQYQGNVNTFLYYRGCYETAKDYLLNEITWYIIGAGVGVAFLMLVGLIVGLALAVCLKQEIKNDETMLADFSYQKPPTPPPTLQHGNGYGYPKSSNSYNYY